jgi:hypothetical protein
MRTDADLQRYLQEFLEGAFSDMPVRNRISIRFGRKAKRRFGSIKMQPDKKESAITINGLFREEWIPEEIILATLAHELCHYAHGFSSPLPKKYKHPHQGGVIEKEMRARGLGHLFVFERKWTKAHWNRIVQANFAAPQRRRRVMRRRRPRSLAELIVQFLQP